MTVACKLLDGCLQDCTLPTWLLEGTAIKGSTLGLGGQAPQI